MTKEDISQEEQYLKQIISSCELMLDDLEMGAKISEGDLKMLKYADRIMFGRQQQVSKQLHPSHYKEMSDKQAFHESTGGRDD